MNTSDKLFSSLQPPRPSQDRARRSGSFLRRLDRRFPWLKLACVLAVGLVALLDLCDITISQTGERQAFATVAPMVHHVRATKRNLDGKMLVALTFDDGPSAETTPALLDTLYKEDVPATFFMLGSRAAASPDLVKRIASAGHEVASHTMYHQNLIRLPASAAASDVDEAKTVFTNILGSAPALTRPPYGNTNNTVSGIIDTPLIMWSVDTLDWQSKDSAAILATALAQVHDGAIILMHDIHPTSVEAVPALITSLRDAGYEFATVSELAKIRGVTLSSGTVYYNFRP